MARIIIGSYLFRFPLGGYMSWVLQWLNGFRRLGHDVYLVERSGYPNSCYDPSTKRHGDDCAYGLETVGRLLSTFGFDGRWCYHDAAGTYHGLSRARVAELFSTADLFVDMGAHGAWEEESRLAGRTALVDGEPGRTQIRREHRRSRGEPVPVYDYYFTVGQNVGSSSTVPTNDVVWHPVFDPVDLDLFPVHPASGAASYTTIMAWQAHQTLSFGGVSYGQKDRSFARFLDLPRHVKVPLEIAVTGQNTPIKDLAAAGWRVRDAEGVTVSFDSWRDYIRGSRGEFAVCKEIFVTMRTGWFSDRSAAYLASGRPVVLQDTGFSAHLPCGRGIFAVQSAEEAAGALDRIETDYDDHARAAREIAREYLETSRVLLTFLNAVGI